MQINDLNVPEHAMRMQTDARVATGGRCGPRVSRSKQRQLPRRPSLLQESIGGKVPKGYIPVVEWLEAAMQRIASPGRDEGPRLHLVFDGLSYRLDAARGQDRVIKGVWRRLEAKLNSICASCGSAGRLRRFNIHKASLCNRCHAPHLLTALLPAAGTNYDTLVDPRLEYVRSYDLPKVWRHAFEATFGAGVTEGVHAVDVVEWLRRLAALKAETARLCERQTVRDVDDDID